MKTVAIALLTGLLAGCVYIKSNVKSEAVPTFSRILVVTKMRYASARYTDSFLTAFPPNYEVCTVALSPLSFENSDEAIRRQAETCKSEVMLTIELTQTGYSGYNSRYSHSPSVPYEFSAEMRSVSTNQPFWKALINVPPIVGEEIPPRSVVKRLLQDQIIMGKLPSPELIETAVRR